MKRGCVGEERSVDGKNLKESKQNVLHGTELILDQNNYTNGRNLDVDYTLDTMESILIEGDEF